MVFLVVSSLGWSLHQAAYIIGHDFLCSHMSVYSLKPCTPGAAGTDPAFRPPPTRVSVDGFSRSIYDLAVDFFSSCVRVETLLVRWPHAC